MDMHMPVMDGIEATVAIRQAFDAEALPILAMTANAMASDRARCLATGMNDHIAKPIDPEHLWSALEAWIRPREGLGADTIPPVGAVAPVAPREESAVRVPAAPATPVARRNPALGIQRTVPGLDVQAGLRRVLGNEASYRALLRRFVDGNREFARALGAALEEGDWSTAERLAHTTKGAAGNLGAIDVQREAGVLEKFVHDRATRSAISAQARSVQARVDALASGLAVPSATPAAAPAEGVDRARLEAVCERLDQLLTSTDSEALDLMERNARLLGAAFPEHFAKLEGAIRSFDFDLAATTLRDARGT
jgi:two-component system sensor histidine kinase/response regulator